MKSSEKEEKSVKRNVTHIYDERFERVDSEERAYWLGFLYADGYNNPVKGYLGIKLARRDRGHLVKFCDFLKIKRNKIKTKAPSTRICMGRKIYGNGSCTVTISGKTISRHLEKLGMVQAKSLILDFPSRKSVPKKFVRHFIRGYFDGDGCLTRSFFNRAVRYRVIFLGTLEFCNGLITELKNIVPLKLWKRRGKVNVYPCVVSGNIQVSRLLEWMYSEASVWLDRKYEKYQGFIENQNRIKQRKTSGYSMHNNITFDKSRNKWIAGVRVPHKTIYLGRFDSEAKALIAQRRASL